MITNVLVVSSKMYSDELRKQYRKMPINFVIVEDEFQALQYLTRQACQAVVIHAGKNPWENAKLLALFRCVVNINVLAVADRDYRHPEYLEYASALYTYPDDRDRFEDELTGMLAKNTMQGEERMDFLYCRGLVFIPCYHKVFYGRNEIQLTNREYALLQLLIENRHKVLHKEQILQVVWADDIVIVSDKTLVMHIKRIRDKIKEFTDKPFIETVHRFGYRFMEYPPPEQLSFAD